MLQYFAFVWSASEPSAIELVERIVERCRQVEPRFRVVLETDGLRVLCFARGSGSSRAIRRLEVSDSLGASTSTNASATPNATVGVVLGTLFTREEHGSFSTADLATDVSSEILRTGGRHLLSHYWGDYVAILGAGRAAQILRGPGANLKCLHTRVENVDIYFSSMPLCAQLQLRKFSINWRHLTRSLLGPPERGETDVQEVTEVLHGQLAHVERGVCQKQMLWDAFSFRSSPSFIDAEAAASALRTTARTCVHAWSTHYGHVLHALSGGLDSSVILACLAASRESTQSRAGAGAGAGAGSSRQHENVVCLTQYASDQGSDERFFARLAASHLGCPLIEHRRHAEVDFRTAIHSVRSENCPGLRLPAVDRVEAEAAHAHDARAIFRGDGGDELFCRNHPSLYVLDFVRERGWRREALSLAVHAATAEGITAWSVLARAALHRFRPIRFNFLATATEGIERVTLIKPEWIRELTQTASLSEPQHRSSPGRLWQASLLSAPRTFTSPFSREDDAEYVAPFFSQPLVELCLQIPTYLQIANHTDRALVRQAFANDLPAAIINRRDKGDAEVMASEMVSRNLPFIREMLLDGIVLRQGFIDRHRLERALEPGALEDAVPSAPLFALLGAEIWARAWLDGANH